jgi:hypothetical protein
MIRIPSVGCVAALSKAACVVGEASSMLTATASIVAASSTIADSSHSTAALVGAVASMVAASASLVGSIVAVPGDRREIVEVAGRRGDFHDEGVRIDGSPALEARERRRLDLRIVADVDDRMSVGCCVWDAPGQGGVFVNGLPEAEYMRDQCLDVLDLTVVGTGGFTPTDAFQFDTPVKRNNTSELCYDEPQKD